MARLSAKAFWALPKAERKVLVAKDILKQMKAGRYDLKREGWINLPDYLDEKEKADKIDLYKDFSKIGTCIVCELGACILSIGHLGNNLNLWETYGISGFNDSNTKAKKLIEKVFTPREIWFLEACFENGEGIVANKLGHSETREDVELAMNFYGTFYNEEERATAMAKNIIRNKGRFIPSQDIKKD